MTKEIKIILPGQDIKRQFPKNIVDDDINYFRPSIEGHSRETAIKKFSGVTINNELFIKEGLRFSILMESFGDTWQDTKYNRLAYQAKSYVKNFTRKKREVNEALWCFDQFSTGGYFHWITEICPRLWIANEYVDPSIPLLIPEYFFNKWPFAIFFLTPFNRTIITFKESETVEVEKMIFISQTGGPFNYQPLAIHSSTEFIKSYYLKNKGQESKFGKKIYISRSKSGKRMVLNEEQIIPILNEHDYEIVYTEGLSISSQIELFSQTTSLLSIHGAGLANMVFMPRGSNVIEIRHEEQNNMLNCFHTLAHTFELEYYYVFGNNKGDTLLSERRPEDKSIHVNIEMLKIVLNSLR